MTLPSRASTRHAKPESRATSTAIRGSEAERGRVEQRIEGLQRELLNAEAELLANVGASTREGDPEQPPAEPPLSGAAIARKPPLAADRIIARALTKREYTEQSDDDSEFGRWYGINPAAWCAMFASWVFYIEGMPLSARTSRGFAYCGHAISWFKDRGARKRREGWCKTTVIYELIAITGGLVVGVGVAVSSSRIATTLLIAAGVASALAAFVLSGEIALSPSFVLWDLVQVVLAALLARVLVGRLIERRLGS